MSEQPKQIYEFGLFRLNAGERLLLRQGQTIPLQPKTFDLLLVLVQNPGHLLEKEELLKAVWPDTIVEEVNLANNISLLRKALGEDSSEQRFVETVPRRGYRFVANVLKVGEREELTSTAQSATHSIHEHRSQQSPGTEGLHSWINHHKKGALLTLVGLLSLIVASVFGFYKTRGRKDSGSTPQVPQVQAGKLTRLTSDSGLTTDPALSADGKLLAYASDRAGNGDLDIWVQQMNDGQTIRLTQHEADEREPTFSSDGKMIAFRSERDGGGIYVMPAAGGEARLIARAGRRPRFSPKGDQIVYWAGGTSGEVPTIASSTNPLGTGNIYVVAAAGGPPRQLQRDFVAARHPVWSPDGKHILFAGIDISAAPFEERFDWWVAPLDGGAAVKTGAFGTFRRQGLSAYFIPSGWVNEGNDLLFSAKLGDSVNLWRVAISPQNWQITAAPQRLTFGTGLEAQPSSGAEGRLVFTSLVENTDIWSLPMDANQGKVTGAMQRLTEDSAPDIHPYLSANGKRLVFRSTRSGTAEVWLKDLESGKETNVAPSAADKFWPIITADGLKVVYRVGWNQGLVYVVAADGGLPVKVCDDCTRLDDWSPDQKYLLYHWGPPWRVSLLNMASGERINLFHHAEYNLFQPHFSPDGHWITFLALLTAERRRLFIVPFRNEIAPKESEWVAVTDGEFSDDKPRFSPDGNLLYFTSNRDGFLCLWAQRLDRVTKRPRGSPFTIKHFHRTRLSMLNVDSGSLDISIARDRVVFLLSDLTGNIWLLSGINRV